MPRASRSIEIEASAEQVFDLIHDYDRRLEWDSMLREARLLGGAENAGLGVRSVCVGTWRGAFLALETEYVSFVRGEVAAVKLTGSPAFFDRFAATIRHSDIDSGRSRTTYIYSFKAKPRFLAPWLEPTMNKMLQREVDWRLLSLKRFLEDPP